MLIPTDIDVQVAAVRDDSLRVLVVGGGVAGVTLAQLLRHEGMHPVLIERSQPGSAQGYMLALMPLVDPVLRWLDVEREYARHSQPLHNYRLHRSTGGVLRQYSFDRLLSEFGDYRGLDRGALLDVLSDGGAPVTFGTTVQAIDQSDGVARVSVAGPAGTTDARFDLVVVADGLHSSTRDLVQDQVDTVDTGWGGWVAWADVDPADAETGDETWGAGWFLGTYPVLGRIGVFLGGDRRDTAAGPERFVANVRSRLRVTDEGTDRALSAVAVADDLYFWSLVDCRSARWSIGRVVLLGDAAAGFLPTAGIGAAMAMESAHALACRAVSTSRAGLPEELRAYERAQRPRVEAAQGNSRQLARLMFHRSTALARARDVTARFVTMRSALRPIRQLLQTAERPPSGAPLRVETPTGDPR